MTEVLVGWRDGGLTTVLTIRVLLRLLLDTEIDKVLPVLPQLTEAAFRVQVTVGLIVISVGIVTRRVPDGLLEGIWKEMVMEEVAELMLEERNTVLEINYAVVFIVNVRSPVND